MKLNKKLVAKEARKEVLRPRAGRIAELSRAIWWEIREEKSFHNSRKRRTTVHSLLAKETEQIKKLLRNGIDDDERKIGWMKKWSANMKNKK